MRVVASVTIVCSNLLLVDMILHTHTTVLLLFWNMSRTTRVSRYQKGKTRKVKTNLDLLEQEIVSGSGICWAICKSAPHPRQPCQHPSAHHSVFYRLDALPAAQPTASKHWRNYDTTTQQTASDVLHFLYNDNNIRLMAPCLRLPGWAVTRKVKPIWIYWSKR